MENESDQEEGGSDEYESDQEETVQDHPSSLGKRVLEGMDSVPKERRVEFLEKFSSFIANFMLPSSVTRTLQEGKPQGEKPQEVPSSPAPTSPASSAASTPPPPTSPTLPALAPHKEPQPYGQANIRFRE